MGFVRPLYDPLQAGDLLAVFVEPLLDPPAVVPGLREAGLHGPICLCEASVDLGEASVDIGPDLGEASVEVRAGLCEASVDLGEASVDIGPDLGEASVETTIEEAEHRQQYPERGQLERHQAGDGAPEYGWIDSHHARNLKQGACRRFARRASPSSCRRSF